MTGWATQKMVINNEFCCCSHEYGILFALVVGIMAWKMFFYFFLPQPTMGFLLIFQLVCPTLCRLGVAQKCLFMQLKLHLSYFCSKTGEWLEFLEFFLQLLALPDASSVCWLAGETFYVTLYCWLAALSERVTFNSILQHIRVQVANNLLWR